MGGGIVRKIALALITAVTLGTTASIASNTDRVVDVAVGYSYLDLGEGTTGQGAVFGWDFAFPLSNKNIELGFDVNFDFYSLSSDSSSYQSLVGGGNVDGTAGYRFFDGKMKAEAGLGYQYLSLADNFFLAGFQYSGSLQYKISKTFTLEAIYTAASLDPSIGSGTFDESKVGFNLRIAR